MIRHLGENLKEAMLYEPLTGGRVKCNICPWLCNIAEDHGGICGVRQNIKGETLLLDL